MTVSSKPRYTFNLRSTPKPCQPVYNMEMQDLLKDLNPEQVQAVIATEGPVLVLAGAGSGKTKALVHRVAYLIQHEHISPNAILAITFTNKAGEEMKKRVIKLIGQTADKGLQISTFHSFCARLLRVEAGKLGFSQNFTITAADDQLAVIKRVMLDLQLDPKRIYPEAVRSSISSAKNELVPPSEYTRLASGAFQQNVAVIYAKYQEVLKQNQAMDFDDLLMKTVELFRGQPEVLEKYQNRFRYILVDEYQDTNTAQYEIVRMLAEKNRNLFVVGDDWQSIYSWRGANYQNILNFNRDYSDATVIKLERNYRSTQNILDAAHAVIVHNQNRSDKKLWTEQTEGAPVIIHEALNEKDEGEFIVREISKLINEEGTSLNDIAILYRTNAQSRSLEESLLQANLPYRVVGGVRFYDRREIRDMVAFLTLLTNPDNRIALERIINLPARGIGPKTIADLIAKADAVGQPLLAFILANEQLPTSVMEFGKTFASIKNQSKKAKLSAIINYILDVTGYKRMLTDEGVEGEARLENIFELKSVMEKYDHLPFADGLTSFLEEVSLISDIDNYRPEEATVTLMTMHSAKGLEFDFVFIAGAEENVFPHSRSLFDQQELEEERRLCYVAITRARKRVCFVHTKERLLYGNLQNNPPSRFLEDLPEHLTERTALYRPGESLTTMIGETYSAKKLKPGVRVEHKQFGSGVIVSRSGDILTVAFMKEGIKKLAAELANLTITK
jgi:DNA helicase II / ATP-dependent DNA helicase PcrA